MEIRRGHLYLADLNPRFGTEPGKLRPVVVIQTNLLNEAGHPSTVICPLTTQVLRKLKWLRIHLKKGESGLLEESDILADQIRAVDNRRLQKKLGALSRSAELHLTQSLKVVLDL